MKCVRCEKEARGWRRLSGAPCGKITASRAVIGPVPKAAEHPQKTPIGAIVQDFGMRRPQPAACMKRYLV